MIPITGAAFSRDTAFFFYCLRCKDVIYIYVSPGLSLAPGPRHVPTILGLVYNMLRRRCWRR